MWFSLKKGNDESHFGESLWLKSEVELTCVAKRSELTPVAGEPLSGGTRGSGDNIVTGGLVGFPACVTSAAEAEAEKLPVLPRTEHVPPDKPILPAKS